MADLGVDIVEIGRIKTAVERHADGFRRRVYTELEWRQCGASFPSLAGRFAAKEAVMKALGVGGMAFRDIEIARAPSGKPEVTLHGRMLRRAERLGVTSVSVSISHSRDNAVAVALAEPTTPTFPPRAGSAASAGAAPPPAGEGLGERSPRSNW